MPSETSVQWSQYKTIAIAPVRTEKGVKLPENTRETLQALLVQYAHPPESLEETLARVDTSYDALGLGPGRSHQLKAMTADWYRDNPKQWRRHTERWSIPLKAVDAPDTSSVDCVVLDVTVTQFGLAKHADSRMRLVGNTSWMEAEVSLKDAATGQVLSSQTFKASAKRSGLAGAMMLGAMVGAIAIPTGGIAAGVALSTGEMAGLGAATGGALEAATQASSPTGIPTERELGAISAAQIWRGLVETFGRPNK